jgi:hypothetical protein
VWFRASGVVSGVLVASGVWWFCQEWAAHTVGLVTRWVWEEVMRVTSKPTAKPGYDGV